MANFNWDKKICFIATMTLSQFWDGNGSEVDGYDLGSL